MVKKRLFFVVIFFLVVGTLLFLARRFSQDIFSNEPFAGFTSQSASATVVYAARVPFRYKALFKQLETDLSSFDVALDSSVGLSSTNFRFGASLIPANSNAGTKLLNSQTFDFTLTYLDALQSLGISTVQLDINFPLLYSGFHEGDLVRQEYIDFYKSVVQEIRNRNMTLAIESQSIFTQDVWSTLIPKGYYESLSFEEYKKGRIETIKTIMTELKPDYIGVAEEPRTELSLTKQPLRDTATYLEMVDEFIAAAVSTNSGNTKIGAGVGTWEEDYKKILTHYANNDSVDFFSIHVYPVNGDLLTRLIEIAQLAKTHGKTIALGEIGLYKIYDKELPEIEVAMADKIYARDVYSFWEPLDKKFFDVLVKFSKKYDVEYSSYFWSYYLFGYLEYSDYKTGTPTQLISAVREVVTQNILGGRTSGLGNYVRELLK